MMTLFSIIPQRKQNRQMNKRQHVPRRSLDCLLRTAHSTRHLIPVLTAGEICGSPHFFREERVVHEMTAAWLMSPPCSQGTHFHMDMLWTLLCIVAKISSREAALTTEEHLDRCGFCVTTMPQLGYSLACESSVVCAILYLTPDLTSREQRGSAAQHIRKWLPPAPFEGCQMPPIVCGTNKLM